MLFLAVQSENATSANGSTGNFLWDNFGYDFITVVYYISLTVLVFCLIVIVLRMCGFGTVGIVKGSHAASYQSAHASVVGSCFSCLQSLAMRLGRILILSALISALLLYGCIKLKDMFQNSPSYSSATAPNRTHNSTVQDLSTSLYDGKESVSDILFFGNSSSHSVSALTTPDILETSNDLSSMGNVTVSIEDIISSRESQDSFKSSAFAMKRDCFPQICLLVLYFVWCYIPMLK